MEWVLEAAVIKGLGNKVPKLVSLSAAYCANISCQNYHQVESYDSLCMQTPPAGNF